MFEDTGIYTSVSVMYQALYYLAFIELSNMGHCSQYLKDFQHVPEHNNIYKNLAEFKHLANNKKLQIIIIKKKINTI